MLQNRLHDIASQVDDVRGGNTAFQGVRLRLLEQTGERPTFRVRRD